MDFFKGSNGHIYVKVVKGHTLSKIILEYSKQYSIPKTSQQILINLTVQINKKEYFSISENKIVAGWEIKLPKSNEIKSVNQEVHKIYFNGKKVEWKNGKNKILLSVNAVSGLKKNNKKINKLIEAGREDIVTGIDYTDKKYQSLSDVGPIPEGTYSIKLTRGVLKQKSGGGWGWGGWFLKPSSIKYALSKLGLSRGGFFLHQDEGNDGTSGCIGVSNQKDIIKIWQMLKEYQQKGKTTIDVIVNY